MREIQAKGGRLNGKKYLVPDHATHLHHDAAAGGTYPIKGNTATWSPTPKGEGRPNLHNPTHESERRQ